MGQVLLGQVRRLHRLVAGRSTATCSISFWGSWSRRHSCAWCDRPVRAGGGRFESFPQLPRLPLRLDHLASTTWLLWAGAGSHICSPPWFLAQVGCCAVALAGCVYAVPLTHSILAERLLLSLGWRRPSGGWLLCIGRLCLLFA